MASNRPTLIVSDSQGPRFASENTSQGGMYEEYFGLRERPFDLVPNPRFLFLTEVQREALSTLRYGLTGPGGLTLLLGDAGTGKTTLVQAALSGMGDDNVQCVLLSNPTLNRDEFYESLTEGFALGPTGPVSKTWFLSALREHAEARRREGKLTAIMLDEAQSLPDELLEEVRLLSNLETSTTKLLSVLLAGQPELGTRLNQSNLRQLKQRIGLRCALRPFDLAETASYLAGRIRIAGGSPIDIFTREAVSVIHEASRGIPRIINVICENALIGGFAAQVKPVSRAIVEEVVKDFDLRARITAPPASGQEPVRSLPAPAATPATMAPASTPPPAAAPDKADLDDDSRANRPIGLFGQRKRFFF